jgi:hypothetical protein
MSPVVCVQLAVTLCDAAATVTGAIFLNDVAWHQQGHLHGKISCASNFYVVLCFHIKKLHKKINEKINKKYE